MDAGRSRAPSPASPFELWLCLVRSWPWLLLWSAGGLGLALALLAVLPPRFQASSTLLIESETPSGFLGDLSMLASLTAPPVAASELVVLESRTLAETTLTEGRDASGHWDPRDERHLGLGLWVQDVSLRPLTLLWQALFEPSLGDRPRVWPPRELLARVTAASDDAPRSLRVRFPASDVVRLETGGLAVRLGLEDALPEELPYRPGEPLAYRGLTLELRAEGQYVGARFELERLPPHEALERLRGSLQVRETALNSGTIEVLVSDSDPRRAARIANALTLNYLDSLSERGQKRASQTVDYIRGLLEEQMTRFDAAQERIFEAQERQPELLSPGGAASAWLEELSTLEVQRVQIDIAQRAFAEIVGALERGDSRALARLDDSLNVGVLVDPVTSGFLVELARLEAEYGRLGAGLLPEHPALSENRAALQTLLERTREQMSERLQELRDRSQDIDQEEETLRQRMTELPSGLRNVAQARIEIEIHRELVPYLIKGLQGAEITRSGADTLADVVDPAAAATELAFPDPARTLLLGLVLGLCGGGLHVLLRQPRRGRVFDAPELALLTGRPRALELRHWRPAPRPLLGAPPAGPAAASAQEELRLLRAQLRARDGAGLAPRVLGVAACSAAEPAGALAAELALAHSLEGRRTLLLEADLRHPSQAERFELEAPGGGLAQALLPEADWREFVRASGRTGLELLPAGTGDASASDRLTGAAMESLLAAAREHYEVLVLSLPPLGEASETLVLGPRCDLLCLLHRARSLPRARLAAAARELEEAGQRWIVPVLLARGRRG